MGDDTRPGAPPSRPPRQSQRRPPDRRAERSRARFPRRHRSGKLQAATRRAAAFVRTPRGAVTSVAGLLLVVGVVGLVSISGEQPVPPEVTFATAQGSAEEIREATLKSVVDGPWSDAVAPGRAGEVAEALTKSPIYHIAAWFSPGEDVLATSRVAFVNTSERTLDDIRFGVLAPAVGADLEVLTAKVDGRRVGHRLDGTTLVVDVAESIVPGGEAVVELGFRLAPRRLEQVEDPAEAITGQPDTRITLVFERKGLVILVDWYPRLFALGKSGWIDKPVVPDAVDFSGPAGIVALALDVPGDWRDLVGGHLIGSASTGEDQEPSEAGRRRVTYVLPGARAMSFVAMPNAVNLSEDRGEYQVEGLALSSFVTELRAAVVDALTAKAALSGFVSPPVWRDTKVAAVALRGPYKSIAVDNLVLVEQSELRELPSERGPGTAQGAVRTLLFAGVASEWWGGIRGIDGTALPGLRDGIRQWVSTGVWQSISGNGDSRRLATATGLAPLYRSGRDSGAQDLPASTAWEGLAGSLQALGIVTSKAGLLHPALADAVRPEPVPPATAATEVSDPALSTLAGRDLFGSLDAGDVEAAYEETARGFGVGPDVVRGVFTRWYDEVHGDEEIGRRAGEGTLVPWTDARTSSPLVSADSFAADPEAVTTAGEGW